MNSRRLLAAALLAIVGAAYYFCRTEVNPVTGEKQHVALTPADEVAVGLQAAPRMAAEFGGLSPVQEAQEYVRSVGGKVVAGSEAKSAPYPFDFHLLADHETVNAFALPGGQVFLTSALLERLGSEGELAGVLGHEIGHVVHRHAAEHLAKQQFTQVLIGAAAVAGSDDRSDGRQAAAVAAVVGAVANLRFSRNDELEADASGVKALGESGYDPRALVSVMEVLERAGGGSRRPDFLSTHPDPGDRKQRIEAEIARLYPSGVPAQLARGDAARFAAIRQRVAAAPAASRSLPEESGGTEPQEK
jgi:predicted Zn-dependent protease